jgi:hypothetical protein
MPEEELVVKTVALMITPLFWACATKQFIRHDDLKTCWACFLRKTSVSFLKSE